MEMLCYWNSFVAFHAGEVQATGAISSVVDLQYLLGTMLVLRVVFNLKTKPTSSSHLHTRQPKRRWVFIVAGLVTSSVWHCWLQPCQRQDHLCLGCSEIWAGNQSWEREEEIWLKLIGFKIHSTYWSCEGSSSICAFPELLKTWLSYKALIALQVFRLIVLSCCRVLFIQNHKLTNETRFVNS